MARNSDKHVGDVSETTIWTKTVIRLAMTGATAILATEPAATLFCACSLLYGRLFALVQPLEPLHIATGSGRSE